MKLIRDNCEPIPPWYPLPLLPPYEISSNWQVRKENGSLIKLLPCNNTYRALLKDHQTGTQRFYYVGWLWRMSQAKDPAELLEMELIVHRDEVLLRLFAKVLSFYGDEGYLSKARPNERVAVLKILASLLYNKTKPPISVEPKVMSIDTLRKYAQVAKEGDDEEYESEYAG